MEHITASDLQQMFADVADAGTYGCFEYQGISVGLHSDEADLLNWFSKFFGGYFTVTASERTDAVVHSSQDPAVFHRLSSRSQAGTCWCRLPARSRIATRPSNGLFAT